MIQFSKKGQIMNYAKKIIVASILSSILNSHAYGFGLSAVSFFNPRSQSTNAAKELVGWHRYINRYDCKDFYGAISLTPSFGQILRAKNVAFALFDTEILEITGSLVPNRGCNDILADYFGLSSAFDSIVCLKPFMRTAILDFDSYFALGDFYLRVHAPFVWVRNQLGVQEEVFDDGLSTLYPAQYMDFEAIPAPAPSFGQAVRGGFTWGQVTQPLNFGKFNCSQAISGMSDVQFALGWNVVNNKYGFAGFNLRFSAPTGSRPKSEFLFEPIVGNGKHWEFGAGFTGRVLLWEKDGEQEFSFFADLNVTHLFNAAQRRSFDFKVNGFGSRYILAKEFDDAGNYTGNSLPAINITTLPVKVQNSIQIDMALMFGYTYNNLVIDIGYNLWFRSHDIICLSQGLPLNRYGLKGIQNVTNGVGNPIPNTQTETATLHGNNLSEQADVADLNPPVFINTSDLDLTSASYPRVLTNKFFGHIGTQWPDCYGNYTPFFGIGGEVEFEGINPRNQILPSKNTLSQWSIWLKGGIGF